MAKKLLSWLPPLLLLLLFAIIMNSSGLVATGIGPARMVPEDLQTLTQVVENQNWSEAARQQAALEQHWQQAVRWLQFSMEKDQAEAIDLSLARLQAFIGQQDQPQAQAELAALRKHWEDMNR